MMQDFYKDFGFIIGFMVLVLLWNMGFGEKSTRYFLLLVLLGMVVLNAGTVGDWLNEKFNLKEGA